MRKLSIAFVLLCVGASAGSAPPRADTLHGLTISTWHDLNAMCRGGHSPESEHACCAREKLSAVLNRMGYCYRTGERWVKCRPNEKKARTFLSDTDCVR